jgi:hypothetical protein
MRSGILKRVCVVCVVMLVGGCVGVLEQKPLQPEEVKVLIRIALSSVLERQRVSKEDVVELREWTEMTREVVEKTEAGEMLGVYEGLSETVPKKYRGEVGLLMALVSTRIDVEGLIEEGKQEVVREYVVAILEGMSEGMAKVREG